MKCGFAKVNIDPPLGYPISGGFRPKYSTGSIDPLHTRALAFSDGEKTSLLIALDVCYMGTAIHKACRERISRECSIPEEAIIITCSHTHQGPLLGPNSWAADYDQAPYISELIDKIAKASSEAISDLCEAKLFGAIGEAKGINYIRRYKMKDGSVVTNPPKFSPEIEYPLGTPDERVKLVKILREGAKDIYLVGYGSHACMVGGPRTSADYPGVVCERIENEIPNALCMFITSAQGDANHVDPFPSEEIERITRLDLDNDSIYRARAKRFGGAIVDSVMKIKDEAEEISSDGVFYARIDMDIPTHKDDSSYDEALKIEKIYREGRADELPYRDMALTTVIANAKRVIRMKSAPDFYTYPMSGMLIGDFAIVGMTGEPFTDHGRTVQNKSPFGFTMLACLSNAMSVYFPTDKALGEGGYEAVTSDIGFGVDAAISDAAERIYDILNKKKLECK